MISPTSIVLCLWRLYRNHHTDCWKLQSIGCYHKCWITYGRKLAIMTDSVSKNVQIGAEVAKILQSSYITYHFSCKSHAFNYSNIHVLADIEKQRDFQNNSQTLNQVVQSFLCGSTIVVECATASVLSLVSHNKSANSTNLAELFEQILQREEQVSSNLRSRGVQLLHSLTRWHITTCYRLNSILSTQHFEIVDMFIYRLRVFGHRAISPCIFHS